MFGGYAGFQQSPDRGRLLVHSIWSHTGVAEPNESLYTLPDALTDKFGGEGTGLKTITFYQWQPHHWYRMVLRAWQDDVGTCSGQWVKDIDREDWMLASILRFPRKGMTYAGKPEMFMENWTPTHQYIREARVRNAWSRTKETQDWRAWQKQVIQGSNDHGDWDGGATSEYFWLRSGGDTKPSNKNGITAEVVSHDDPRKEPSTVILDPVARRITPRTVEVDWRVRRDKAPQFAYEIKIYDNTQWSGTPLGALSKTDPGYGKKLVSLERELEENKVYYARILVTDIFDRSTAQTWAHIPEIRRVG
ncbi:DUF3472 domain-containing protein [Streptomyces sp. T1317-0309]|nr:DUF3472 domain-containing protein [Streptomyces sp. T1317-0309]